MKVSVVQPDLVWENKQANLRKLSGAISALNGKTDIVILPEMFSTGFSMAAQESAEDISGSTFEWMKALAYEGNFGLCGSFIIKEGIHFYNSFVFVSPDAEPVAYNKRHLFSMGDEDKRYTRGKTRIIFPFRGFRICPFICYDLRFPVWSRNRNDYDLAIYVANWPESRINVWNILLKARAIENQCYVVASNRIGNDGMGIKYNGSSQIINPKGEIIAIADNNKESIISSEISLKELQEFRDRFNVLRDSDDFQINT